MRFSIFSHAEHCLEEGKLFSYGPYVKEMNLWIENIEKVKVIAPLSSRKPSAIDKAYQHKNTRHVRIPPLHYKGDSFFKNIASSLEVLKTIFNEMKAADHIHIRCPGNVGMLAMIVSSLFPRKPKTVKYAGNWDPKSKQPLSYRFQKWWLSNTFLNKNMKVLVYGKWQDQTKNIISFFTASFSEREKVRVEKEFKHPFRFLFCGSLTEGKCPLLAAQVINKLRIEGFDVSLDIYGEGPEKTMITNYIEKNDLKEVIRLQGNQPQRILKEAYREAHFCILPSKSEGWPKALAEGMFFGCISIGTKISCVPWMLGEGYRGILLSVPPLAPHQFTCSPLGGTGVRVDEVVEKISQLLGNEEEMKKMSKRAQEWSQEYTLEKFEAAIKEVLKN